MCKNLYKKKNLYDVYALNINYKLILIISNIKKKKIMTFF